CARDLVTRDVDFRTIVQAQPDVSASVPLIQPEELALQAARAPGEYVLPANRDLFPGVALKIARPHERPLDPGRGDLEHVPLGHSLRLVQPGFQGAADGRAVVRSEEHTSELQSRENLVCRLLLA